MVPTPEEFRTPFTQCIVTERILEDSLHFNGDSLVSYNKHLVDVFKVVYPFKNFYDYELLLRYYNRQESRDLPKNKQLHYNRIK